MKDPVDSSDEKSDVVEAALRASLRVNALSPEALSRIRAEAEGEWRALARSPSRRRWRGFAMAASIALATLAVSWSVRSLYLEEPTPVVVGNLVRLDSPGVRVSKRFVSGDTLQAGAPLHVGQSLIFEGNAAVDLASGETLRVARGTTLYVEAERVIQLRAGDVYLEVSPSMRTASGMVLRTNAGDFQHVGTQFMLETLGDNTVLRVREGSVRWQSDERVETTNAGTELVIGPDQKVSRKPIATSGKEWAWVEALAPAYEIENRSLSEFLGWVSRETGRTLTFADSATRQQAMKTTLHGSIHGLAALEALSTVMQTTSLHHELLRGEIRISSSGAKLEPK
ncbi:MAG: FecR domain-containing protein [Pseudomonadota bacterium]